MLKSPNLPTASTASACKPDASLSKGLRCRADSVASNRTNADDNDGVMRNNSINDSINGPRPSEGFHAEFPQGTIITLKPSVSICGKHEGSEVDCFIKAPSYQNQKVL